MSLSTSPKKFAKQFDPTDRRSQRQLFHRQAHITSQQESELDPVEHFWALKQDLGQPTPPVEYEKQPVEPAQPFKEPFVPRKPAQKQVKEVSLLTCPGCGVKLQSKDKRKSGFIKPKEAKLEWFQERGEMPMGDIAAAQALGDRNEHALLQHLRSVGAPEEVIREFQRQPGNQEWPEPAEQSPEILDLDSLVVLDELSEQNESMFIDERKYKRQQAQKRKEQHEGLCERCRSLRFENKPYEEEEEDEKVQDAAGTLLAPHVKSFDREKLLKTMLPKIYSRSVIVYVCDAANFEASIVPEVFEMIQKERHRVLIVMNKIDALPKGFKLDTLQLWVKRQIARHVRDISMTEDFHVCLTSAKKVTGVDKILTILERTRNQLRDLRYLPKVYVMGTTNSGKSTLINSLLKASQRKKLSKKGGSNAPGASKKRNQEPVVLTESALPGTTQELVTVEQFNIGFRVIDTPGIPNMSQVSAQIGSFRELAKLMPSKEMSSFSTNVKSGYSVWMGALARLDFISGDDKYLTFVAPQDVTVHRTPIEKADDIFVRQAGSLLKPSLVKGNADSDTVIETLEQFQRHEINLNCTDFKLANFEIVIEGLGWVGVQGIGFASFILHVPAGVKFHVRDDPMRPHILIDKKLKKYTGNTINARTRRNMR